MDIHPDIRAFWEYGGYTVKPRFPTAMMMEDYTAMFWDQVKDKVIKQTVAFTSRDGSPTVYYLDGEQYVEAEMLRIIKLKAFL